jgi:predicted TIM-barrel fold metal-dependent hydrolase
MTYSDGRRYYDADSHIMETMEWLHEHATDRERRLLPELAPRGAGKLALESIRAAEARRASAEATAKLLEQPLISGPKGWQAYGASTRDERSRALDLLGFERQLVFPTFSLGQFVRSDDLEVVYAGAHALNRGMGHFCGSDSRMLAVGYLPLQDVARSLRTLDDALRVGVRAFWVTADALDDRSPSHVDHEPLWERLAHEGTPVILHVGLGTTGTKPYHNNGRPAPSDWLGGGENMRSRDFPAIAHAAENFLTSMILDGVFERHERLRCGVIELGGSWVPGFLRLLDHAAVAFRRTEPLLQQLTLKPSEYMRRQVRVSLFPFEDAGWLVEQAGPELFMFASDYPHPEGGNDPIERFEAALEAHRISESAAERFRHGNFADLMSL